MKIVKPSFEILTPINGYDVLKHIELCGRTCYKSEAKITEQSCFNFAKNIIKRGHEAVLEHFNITVRFTVDRGVSHEIVRHRLASYCQESTRYCNYSNADFGSEITVIEPFYLKPGTPCYAAWESACKATEEAYFIMLQSGCTPQEARAVLPNSLKTEIVMTANLREWRHFFKLRCSTAAHPQMREIVTQQKEYAETENRCVVCDEIIPEGRQVCPTCEAGNTRCKHCGSFHPKGLKTCPNCGDST